MRIWFKEWKDGRLLRDTVVEDAGSDTRTHKIFRSLESACMQFDLAQPIRLDKSIKDFQRHSRCRFTQDAFIEEIPFDYLEMHVIEED